MLKKGLVAIFAGCVLAQLISAPQVFGVYSEQTKPEEVSESRVIEQEKAKQQNILTVKPQIVPPKDIPAPAGPETGMETPMPSPKPGPAKNSNLILAGICLAAALILMLFLLMMNKNKSRG